MPAASSSLVTTNASTVAFERSSDKPPPGTQPSSIAERTARSELRILSVSSVASISVVPPTRIVTTLPPKAERRSCNPACSNELVDSLSSFLIARSRFSMLLGAPAPSMRVVRFFVTITLLALPSILSETAERFGPASAETTVAPVSAPKSSNNALRRSPWPGALTAALRRVSRDPWKAPSSRDATRNLGATMATPALRANRSVRPMSPSTMYTCDCTVPISRTFESKSAPRRSSNGVSSGPSTALDRRWLSASSHWKLKEMLTSPLGGTKAL